MIPDPELLRQYAAQGDETAFAEVVRRHTNLVYSVALRVTRNGALAEDATQGVFTQLARQAARLSRYDTLIGWLHTTTRHIAIDLIRSEARRRAREQEASLMQNDATDSAVNWEVISPLLDEAVGRLGEADRKAVLLRYFQNLSHREIGALLGLSENSANKRVERAMEKLREGFEKRGVKASSALLATAIAENSVQAAPTGLAARVAGSALEAATAAGVSTVGLILGILSTSTRAKLLIAAAIIVIAATFTLGWLYARPLLGLQLAGATSHSNKLQPTDSAQVEQPVLAAANPLKPAKQSTVEPTGNYDPRTRGEVAKIELQSQIDEYASTEIGLLQSEAIEAMQMHLTVDEKNLLQADIIQLKSFENVIPTLNAEGNEATYMADPQTWAKVKALLAESKDPELLNLVAKKVVFVKTDDDGKWYLSIDDLWWSGADDTGKNNPKYPDFKNMDGDPDEVGP